MFKKIYRVIVVMVCIALVGVIQGAQLKVSAKGKDGVSIRDKRRERERALQDIKQAELLRQREELEVKQRLAEEGAIRRKKIKEEQQRIEEERQRFQERFQEAMLLRNKKAEMIRRLEEESYLQDKEKYNELLCIAKELLDPYTQKKRSRGGVQRFEEAVLILSKLVDIHKSQVYGSSEKRAQLNELIEYAWEVMEELNQMPKYSNNEPAFLDGIPEELMGSSFRGSTIYNEINSRKTQVRTVGGNISAGVILGGGLGLSAGVSKTAYGSRRCAFLGQGVGSLFLPLGVSLMFGKYEWNKKKRQSRILSKGKKALTRVLLLGGVTQPGSWLSHKNSISNTKLKQALL